MAGLASPDRADRRRERAGAAVGQVVARHASDDRVLEAERAHRLGHPGRLVRVAGLGSAGVDQAEAAGPGAALAEDHERGGAVGPALVDVRAARLLAHRVQLEAAGQDLEVPVPRAEPGPHLHPLGTTERVVGRGVDPGLGEPAEEPDGRAACRHRGLASASRGPGGRGGARHRVAANAARSSGRRRQTTSWRSTSWYPKVSAKWATTRSTTSRRDGPSE